jgi:hypothetical protein
MAFGNLQEAEAKEKNWKYLVAPRKTRREGESSLHKSHWMKAGPQWVDVTGTQL